MKRVLAVDDLEENLHLLRVLLESQGYEVQPARNGAEALAIARENPPDLVVSDILMPVMDGFALCRTWKADEHLCRIPFIFYTATYTDPKDEQLARDLGADAFITKPAEPEDFLAAVLATLARAQTAPAAPLRTVSSEAEGVGKQYNEVLVRKLEDKMLQLDKANRALEQEIEARREAEGALQESERKFRGLFETMSQGVMYQNGRGEILTANPAAERILGVSVDEMRGRTPRDSRWQAVGEDGSEFPADQHPADVALRTGAPVGGVILGVSPQSGGERRWVLVDALPQYLPGEISPSSVYTTFTDVTERELAVDALRRQLAFDDLIAGLLSQIASASAPEISGHVNDTIRLIGEFMGAESVLVFEIAEDLSRWGTVHHWAAPGFTSVAGSLENIHMGTLPWIEERVVSGKTVVLGSIDDVPSEAGSFRRLWDEQRLTSALLVPLHGRGAVVRGCLALFRVSDEQHWDDPTIRRAEQLGGALATVLERKRVEDSLRESDDRLRQSQKMEAIGQLAGGIAHDFNNLLTAIIGYSNLALSRFDQAGTPLERDILEIRSAAERASALTRQILAFSRRQTLRPAVVSLNDIVVGMEPLLRHTFGEGIDLTLRLDRDLGHVEIDTHQFEQVLLNLAVNARDAMPAGGRLTVETRNIELGEEYRRIHPEATLGDHVMLMVSDTGVGMDDATRARIFEPFFTTKDVGKGTGLGLSTVYGIVKQSGGIIDVYSQLGSGTSFKIHLPRAVPLERAKIPAIIEPTVARADETILVVEDEPALQRLVVRVLSSLGYTIRAVTSGDEAMAFLVDDEQRCDLLLTDIVLPGTIQGNALAEQARNFRPRLPVICMSGYAFDAVENAGRLTPGAIYLEKPFKPEELAALVRKVLDGGTGST